MKSKVSSPREAFVDKIWRRGFEGRAELVLGSAMRGDLKRFGGYSRLSWWAPCPRGFRE